MLIPADLRRIPSPLLRARLVAHLLDEPRGGGDEYVAIMIDALTELLAGGASVTELADATGLPEHRLRRLVTRPLAA